MTADPLVDPRATELDPPGKCVALVSEPDCVRMRCGRRAPWEVDGRPLCTQHAKIALKRRDEQPQAGELP